MTELPQGLRKEIALAINVPLFKKLSFFHTFPDNIMSVIASHMSPLQVGHLVARNIFTCHANAMAERIMPKSREAHSTMDDTNCVCHFETSDVSRGKPRAILHW